jgi:hypothetical protein
VAGAFVHDLHAFGPGAAGEFALRFEFAKLRAVIGVGDGAGAQAVADGDDNSISLRRIPSQPETGRQTPQVDSGVQICNLCSSPD